MIGNEGADEGVLNGDISFGSTVNVGVNECGAGPLYWSNCLHIEDCCRRWRDWRDLEWMATGFLMPFSLLGSVLGLAIFFTDHILIPGIYFLYYIKMRDVGSATGCSLPSLTVISSSSRLLSIMVGISMSLRVP